MVDMSLRDKARIAKMSKEKLSQFRYASGLDLRRKLQWRKNYRLL
jgi:hypothetical protein